MELFMYIIFLVLVVLIVREFIPEESKTHKKSVDVRELNQGIMRANEELAAKKFSER